MDKVPLSEFAEAHGQIKAAEMLGITQGALSKAIRLKRNIYVHHLSPLQVKAEEIKPFPSGKSCLPPEHVA